MTLQTEEEKKWIAAAQKGNRLAFRRLVEKYQSYVFTIALRVLKQREPAEEVAQDVFLKVFQTLDSFEGKSKFSTWLYTITYRSAIDVARKKRLHTQDLEDERTRNRKDDFHEDGLQRVSRQDLQENLQAAIDQLDPLDASIITLYYLQEKMVKEIAEITGLTETNIKTKLYRLRDRLRDTLTQQLGTEIEDML
jgi:RNA polymerase sigma-70 factor (ECF subfamily)